MVQGGGGLRFALEAREGVGIFGDIIGEEFEGDVAVEANVFGFVDDAHAAAAKFLEDAVVGDGVADEGVGVRHSAAILGCVLRLSQRIEVFLSKLLRNVPFLTSIEMSPFFVLYFFLLFSAVALEKVLASKPQERRSSSRSTYGMLAWPGA